MGRLTALEQWLVGILLYMGLMLALALWLILFGEGKSGLRRLFSVEMTDHPEWVKLLFAHVTFAVARIVVPVALLGLAIIRVARWVAG